MRRVTGFTPKRRRVTGFTPKRRRVTLASLQKGGG